MTGVIAIDESGDLGSSGTTCFSMAAIVMMRSRHLMKVAKMIPDDGREHKWGNTDDSKRRALFKEMVSCQFNVVYSVVNKNQPSSGVHVYGNQLYERFLRQVLADAMSALQCRDVNIIVDRSRFVTLDRLREIAQEEAVKADVNIKKCEKITSQQNKCIQIVDYVAGAVRSSMENGDDTLSILDEKISVARRY